jgi:3-dehydroquinate synthase class II
MATQVSTILEIDRGEDFSMSFDVVDDDNGLPIDLSGFTISSTIRKHETSVANWPFSTSANSSGIYLSMTAAITSTIPEGYYAFDVRVTDTDGKSSYPIRGKLKVNQTVTYVATP